MVQKVIGVILLIAGVAVLLFGFAYINSPQYKVMSVVNGFTGSSDPTGNVAIGIGAAASVIGLLLLLIGGSSKKVALRTPASPQPPIQQPVAMPSIPKESPAVKEMTVSVSDKATQTDPAFRAAPAMNNSPHLIYAGAGLIAVLAIVGSAIWMNRSNQRNETSMLPMTQSNMVRPVSNVYSPTPTPVFGPKQTTPRGPIQASGVYKNYNNDLEMGVAYKYASNPAVYVYDGQYLRWVDSEQAYFDFYGCGTSSNLMNCAPIYEMPSFVTPSMMRGNVQAKARPAGSVPTVKEMQDTIESEVKKMVDAANR